MSLKFKKLNYTLIIILLFLFGSNKSFSQEYENILFDRITSENIKVEKGLSQNTINSIIQDKEGYMWFGTWDGLNKYDGYNFTIYNKENGLSNSTILALYNDENDNIWIGTEDGLNILNKKTGHITVFRHIPDDSTSITNNWINQIYSDKDGLIWVATGKGLNRYNKNTKNFIRYLNKPRDNTAFKSNWINQIYKDDSIFWMASRYGLIEYDSKSKITTRYYHTPNDPQSLSDNLVQAITKDSEGNLWIGTRNGLNKFNYKTRQFINYKNKHNDINSLSNNDITVIFEDSFGKLWIGTNGGGLNLFDCENKKFIHYENISNKINSLSNNFISCIFEDRCKTIWVGTFVGVNKIDFNSSQFALYRNIHDDPNSLNDNVVWAFIEDEPGVYWIATTKGINIFNEKTGDFQFIKHDPSSKNTISSNNIRALHKDKYGIYWIGTQDKGLVKYNKQLNKFTKYCHNPKDMNSITGNYVLAILEDSYGILWVSTSNGLNKLNRKTNKFKRYFFNPADTITLGNNAIFNIVEDSKGNLWLPSYSGLIKYNRKSNNFTTYKHDPDNINSISTDKLFSVYEDNSGNIWVTSRGGGICKLNPETEQFINYTIKDGLPNNVTYGILEDPDSNLWISTNWGLSKFNVKENKFINYDVKDGLQSNEFNTKSFLLSSGGKMFFGGMGGFNCFFPEQIKVNKNIPPVVITGIKIFNLPHLGSLSNGDTIILNHDDNFVSLGFSALDYTNPSKNKYKYILENYEKNWRYTDAGNISAEYTKVNPGTYIFRVKGSNNDGYWNEEGVSLTIKITPPWWQTWIFRILLALAIILIIWFVIYRRVKAIRQKHEVEKKVLEIEKQFFDIEQKALRLQMNPHFIFNSLNSIQSFVITNDTDKAIFYLAKFSQLMRLILANSSEPYIPLKNELSALKYYMDIEKLRFDNKFDYSIKIDPQIDEEFMEIPPMLIQPYLENAIIHGLIHKKGKGKININFTLKDNSIFCTIQDNGIGREKAMQIRAESGIARKSRGMLITKERLEILNKQNKEQFSVNIIDLKDSKGNATGTRVEIIISYKEF